MGKSPGKWIKTVLFGKKSSKSNLSKDANLDKKISITAKSQSKDFGADPMVISSPVRPVINVSGEHVELEKSSSANIRCDAVENVRSTMGLNVANDDELIKLEQAATKAQAAFRGYLARRAFWALKGIIRLQALVRGHLVRRQAVATLSCMRAIVEFQALVRGQRVRLSWNGSQVLQNNTSGELLHKKRADLLGTSLRSEKLSTNAFATKLVASSNTTMPLRIQYDPTESNSVRNWLERWSSSHFWEPLPRPKRTLDLKPKRKQNKSQSEETEISRPKRSVRKVPAPNHARKMSTHQVESMLEQPHNELEKVKRSLRKISVSTAGVSGKPEIATEKLPEIAIEKLPEIANEKLPEIATEKLPASLDKDERGRDHPFEKDNDANAIATEPKPQSEQAQPEALPGAFLDDEPFDFNPRVEPNPPPVETNGKVESEPASNLESNGKENQKTRRRKSFPVKQEYSESVNTPALPSYMAATESAKAKLRAQAAAKAAEDGAENVFVRRHSLPSSTGKPSLQSPRVHKPLQANGKGASKTNKPQISPRDEKGVSAGWRR